MGVFPAPGHLGVCPADLNCVGTSQVELKRAKFRMPVDACGYNWLACNTDAAERLRARIEHVVAENNGSRCEQVVLVTHSMGGLVARCCARLPGMSERIAGVVHGVMPAVGAAVAYRRCKVGMRDESFVAGLVIGSNGREVTAVFAQAPGALQLLPNAGYRPGWLRIQAADGGSRDESQPLEDPYEDIYLRRDRWWGLVREEWLSPRGGAAHLLGCFRDECQDRPRIPPADFGRVPPDDLCVLRGR